MALAVYVICFSIGIMSHGYDFYMHGWRPYRWGVVFLDVFWTTLILLDALVVGLLLVGGRRSGLLVVSQFEIGPGLRSRLAGRTGPAANVRGVR